MYAQIRAVVEADFLAVDKFIVEQLHSDVSLVENIGHYIVEAGGKRLRPLLVLLTAQCGKVRSGQHIPMAAVIEFIHTATLLHDDVVDMSTLRRGRPTVNAEWNNPSSVLVGDFIYSRAFQILVGIGDMRIMKLIADTTNKIAEGEVLQLITKHNPASTEANYMQVIRDKTAILFQAAAQCGAILGGVDSSVEAAFTRFGMHLGIAFQLIDDVLDYSGDSAAMGKNIGDDLAEGKPTLPLIYAMAHGDERQVRLIRESLSAEVIAPELLSEVLSIVQQSGALEYSRQLARKQAEMALNCLKAVASSKYKSALEEMVEFSINRNK